MFGLGLILVYGGDENKLLKVLKFIFLVWRELGVSEKNYGFQQNRPTSLGSLNVIVFFFKLMQKYGLRQ